MLKNILLLATLGFALGYSHSDTPNNPPNILFAISDDQSFPHAGAYGCDWIQTPAFDFVAKEGLLFNQAFTPNAKCSPSRACILTGRNSWQLENATNHVPFFPEKFKTFPEVLNENGYLVGRTGKGWSPGVAEINGQARDLIVKNYSDIKLEPAAKHVSPTDYASNFKAFLQGRKKGQPFFFWYGAHEPHRRYQYGVGEALAKKSRDQIDEVPPFWPDNDSVRTDMLDYAYEVEYFDQHLSVMLDELKTEGLLDNTIVIVTADNGMPFPRIKGQTYAYDNHLPLAIMWKNGIKRIGRKIDDFVNFIDFAPSILEAAGIPLYGNGMQKITGNSLLDIFEGTEDKSGIDRSYVLIGKERHDIGRPNDEGYPVRGIVQGTLAYTRNFESNRWPAGDPITGYLNCDGSPTKTVILNERRRLGSSNYWDLNFGKRPTEELYDLSKDPWCVNNLADDPAFLADKQRLEKLMMRKLTEQQDPRALGNGKIFDEYPYAHEATKDFYTRFMAGEKMNTGWVNPGDFEKESLE